MGLAEVKSATVQEGKKVKPGDYVTTTCGFSGDVQTIQRQGNGVKVLLRNCPDIPLEAGMLTRVDNLEAATAPKAS